MITNKFSQALAPLLTTANIISPTTNLDKETHLHPPADPTACPFDVSYKPNIDCHPSKVFSMIGYNITITNTTPLLPTNQYPPSSLDCITNYTASADLSLQDHARNKLNQTNNRRTTPPISGDDVIGNLLQNQMILTPVAIDAHGQIGPMVRQNLYGIPPPAIPPRKQFKPNRPNAKAMYERATTLPAPIGIFIEADQQWKQLQADLHKVNKNSTDSAITLQHLPQQQSTIQQLGLGIVHAFSTLILNSFKKLVHSQTSPAFDHMIFYCLVTKSLVYC
jgi:hypothetical protein